MQSPLKSYYGFNCADTQRGWVETHPKRARVETHANKLRLKPKLQYYVEYYVEYCGRLFDAEGFVAPEVDGVDEIF